MLVQRLAVAAVGLPLLGLLIWLPEVAFSAAVMVILGAATYEMLRALAPDQPHSLGLGAAAMATLFVAVARTTDEVPLWSFLVLTAGALTLVLHPRSQLGNSLGGWWTTAVLYVGVLGAHIVLLRNEPEGQRWLVVLLAATFGTDTGAYAAGRLFGRRRLAPRISPNKTWEGAAGGLLTGALAGIAATVALGMASVAPFGGEPAEDRRGVEAAALAAIALALPVAAIAGDLLESALKRRMDVKDMSALLPGHGGLLDRLDSLLVVGVCLYWIVRWLQT